MTGIMNDPENDRSDDDSRRETLGFTLEHMKTQFEKFAKPGLMQRMLRLLPGTTEIAKMMRGDDASQQIGRLVGIISSMTPQERYDPDLIDIARQQRIARGAGVQPQQVSALIKQFEGMKKMKIMEGMAGKAFLDRTQAIHEIQKSGMLPEIRPRPRRRRRDDLW